MGGYSQGGQVLHNAAALLPASTMEAVNSIVIFGDPGTAYSHVALSSFCGSIFSGTMANKRPRQMTAKLWPMPPRAELSSSAMPVTISASTAIWSCYPISHMP